MSAKRQLPNIHPGEILFEEFLAPLDISQYRLAKDINVHPRRINQLVHRERSISANTALRLSKYFGTSAQFWLGLQMRYDLDVEEDRSGQKLDNEVKSLQHTG